MASAEARLLLNAEFLPPAELGDVWRICQEQPAAIGIVDGYFHQVPAVSHKEILYALSRGIAVYGAASMGALRAAELSAFGMVGVGAIAAGYASGELDADDEVALVHATAEFGYRGSSEPLVNIRATIAAMQRDSVVAASTAKLLLALARSLPYPDRVWPRLQDAVPRDESRALAAWLPGGRVDQKRQDAVAMLERMRADSAASPCRPKHAPPAFIPTVLWQELVQRETPLADIVDEFLLLDPLPNEVGSALGCVRRAHHVEGCEVLSAAPEWPSCCRRARLKRSATGLRDVEPSAANADRLLSWFFAKRLGWPVDLSAFLQARGWAEPQVVLRVAAREAAFLNAGTGDAFDPLAPGRAGRVAPD